MLPAHGSRLLAAVVLSLAAVPARPADKNDFDKRWTQAEQNVRSGPGQQYFDNVFFKELSGKYAVHMTECAQRTGERLMVDLNAAVELGPHGQVMAILVRPQTKSSKCFAELMKRDTFSPPPAAHFWIPVTIKFTMH